MMATIGTDLEATTLLSTAAYRSDSDSIAGENDLAESLDDSGWSIIRPSRLGLATLDPDNEYFEIRVGNTSGPIAAAFLAERNGVLAIAFRGSDETGDQFATVNNQSGYFASYSGFLAATLLYAGDPHNAITELVITGHSLGGVMAEWTAERYSAAIASLELQSLIVTFGSPGTNITTPASELAQSILHFGHTGDPIFQHQGVIGSFLNGLVREGMSLQIDLPNVDQNDSRLNFNEHDLFLYERSVPALIGSHFGARILSEPNSHEIIVDTVIAAADDQVTLDFSAKTNALAIIGESGATTSSFTDTDTIKGGSAGDWLDGGAGDDTLFGMGGADELFGGIGNDTMFGGAAADSLFGSLGADVLWGDDDNDYLNGGDDGDSLYGEAGNDTLDGEQGTDYLNGGVGTDSMCAGAGDDVMQGAPTPITSTVMRVPTRCMGMAVTMCWMRAPICPPTPTTWMAATDKTRFMAEVEMTP